MNEHHHWFQCFVVHLKHYCSTVNPSTSIDTWNDARRSKTQLSLSLKALRINIIIIIECCREALHPSFALSLQRIVTLQRNTFGLVFEAICLGEETIFHCQKARLN
jgi:hypothetical protein